MLLGNFYMLILSIVFFERSNIYIEIVWKKVNQDLWDILTQIGAMPLIKNNYLIDSYLCWKEHLFSKTANIKH